MAEFAPAVLLRKAKQPGLIRTYQLYSLRSITDVLIKGESDV